MQDAAKALDAAQKNLDAKEIDKAVATYTKTSGSYRKLLEAASKEDKGVDYKAALTELDRGMDRILAAFQEAVKALAQGKAEELLKEAEKNSTAIQKEFDAGYQAFKDAYSAYEECKRIVRTVCDTAATDTKGAKKLAAGLSVPCKNIATLSGRIDMQVNARIEEVAAGFRHQPGRAKIRRHSRYGLRAPFPAKKQARRSQRAGVPIQGCGQNRCRRDQGCCRSRRQAKPRVTNTAPGGPTRS
jgi:hypothetical protein